MKLKPLTVLADDLTGACELAAIGHQWGLRTLVQIRLEPAPGEADLVVYDTETRLDTPEVATTKLRHLADQLAKQSPQRFLYKKTDSVLRGPVAAEIKALLEGMDYQRSLFLPANPAMGRIVRHGTYYIHGVPLQETGFSRDLHHPAGSSVVRELLGTGSDLDITELPLGGSMPDKGLIIGDAVSDSELDQWADLLDGQTLPSGAASFFRAILRRGLGPAPEQTAPGKPMGRTLLVSGTTDPNQQEILDQLATAGYPAVSRSLNQLDASGCRGWAQAVSSSLENHPRCMAYVNKSVAPDPARSSLVRDSLARLAREVIVAGKVRHLVVEGGATAASVCQAMGWETFIVEQAWAQGIVSLRPSGNPELLFTLKPGSYPWPENFKSILAGTTPA